MPRKTQYPWSQKGLYSSRRDPTCQCGCSDGDQVPRYILVTWRNMMQRCHLETHPSYHRYGGRGLGVCARLKNPHCFYQLLGPRPEERFPESGRPVYTLGRSNGNAGYHCGECEECQSKGQTRNIQWSSTDQQHKARERGNTGRRRGRIVIKRSRRSTNCNNIMDIVTQHKIDLINLLQNLDPLDKKIIEGRLAGRTYISMSPELGLTHQTLHWRFWKALDLDCARPSEPYVNKAGGRYRAAYWNPLEKKTVHLGTFDSLEEAKQARREFADQLKEKELSMKRCPRGLHYLTASNRTPLGTCKACKDAHRQARAEERAAAADKLSPATPPPNIGPDDFPDPTELLAKSRRFIHGVIKEKTTHGNQMDNTDDIYQDTCLELMMYLRDLDDLPSQLTPAMQKVIRNAVAKSVHQYTVFATESHIGTQIESLDLPAKENYAAHELLSDENSPSAEEIVIQREEEEEKQTALEQFHQIATPEQQQIFSLLADNATPEEIGEILTLAPKTVTAQIKYIRHQLTKGTTPMTPELRNHLLEPFIDKITQWSPDDHLGAAFEAAIHAIDAWNPQTHPDLEAYLQTKIERAIQNESREYKTQYHLPKNEKRPPEVALDANSPQGMSNHELIAHPNQPNPHETMEKSQVVDNISVGLTPKERITLDLLADGLNQKEIAQTLGLTPAAVCIRLKKARNKIAAKRNSTAFGK